MGSRVIILCASPGFRRAGIAHPERAEYPLGRFTASELLALRAEPMLSVQIIDGPADAPPAAGRASLAGMPPSLAELVGELGSDVASEQHGAAEDGANAAADSPPRSEAASDGEAEDSSAEDGAPAAEGTARRPGRPRRRAEGDG
ncbi:HI1506-related protein [Pseudoroseomonas cervicalis]|uniref:Mu-like prophage FluMu N-terminal domain-containing protein n=1 Tax=Pseudoroseomonas cervicalis ATCC 49957 TaxID=525371 RepID=D5RM77_9PROT|nr:HI1506-related protein [Pseudoroseomonas cervicalis]EFH11593.1 hypothetical protein HMPREF0731_2188 [Pseudoroseomonas cervicalis ATCC 49957]